MRTRYTNIISIVSRFALLVLLMVGSLQLTAQKLKIEGRLKVEDGSDNGARMVVYKNGQKVKTLTSGLSNFALDLDLQSDYIISFEKDGYVSKKLSFNTKAPSEAIENGFAPFNFVVSIFEQYDDMNTVVFNQPVGMIRYEPDVDDFDYDTDYTKSIQSQLDEALEELEKRKDEKKKNAKQVEKAEAAAAKAKAKAEEAAAKRAVEAEKAKAKEEERLADEKKEQEEKRETQEAERKENERELAEQKAEQERELAEQREKDLQQQKEEEEKVKPEPEPVVKKEDPPAPPPVPQKKPDVPKPKPTPPPPARNSLLASVVEGEDGRRTLEGVDVSEEDPTRMASVNKGRDAIEEPIIEEPILTRSDELVVEGNKVITIVTVTEGEEVDEYRKVIHKWGGVFYFKNGDTCSALVYQSEGLGR